jgi:DNA-binding NtrC family response regulator
MGTGDLARSILVVEDDPRLRELLETSLEIYRGTYRVERARMAPAAPLGSPLDQCSLLVIDGDHDLRRRLWALREFRRRGRPCPAILLGCRSPSRSSLRALRPIYYLPKPFSLGDLRAAIDWALPVKDDPSTSKVGSSTARSGPSSTRDADVLWVPNPDKQGDPYALIAKSRVMKDVLRLIHEAAASDATVLLLGESGTGKDLLSKVVHGASPRRDKGFLHITCTALAEALLESELFGHEEGAFTDAKMRKRGLLELAEGGTVLMNEIGDMSPRLQAKLLRAMEEKAFRRVGGTDELKVDVRIIAATHRDLARMAAEGLFREDLYYRLNIIRIWIPPLREHLEDVPLLIEMGLRELAAKRAKPAPIIDEKAMDFLAHYAWPGNVRQLRNTLERMVALAPKDPIRVGELERYIVEPVGSNGKVVTQAPPPQAKCISRETFHEVLREVGGNMTRAAEKLGICRAWIYELKKEYGA